MYFQTGNYKILDVTMSYTQTNGKTNYFVYCKDNSIPENFEFGDTVGCYSDDGSEVWGYPTTEYLRVYIDGNTIICTHEPAPPEPTLEELKQNKIYQIKSEIYAKQQENVSIKYTVIEEHEYVDEFLTTADALFQIMNAYLQTLHGAKEVLLKSFNKEARFYSSEFISKLCKQIIQRNNVLSLNEKYLMRLIEEADSKAELSKISLGMSFPDEVQKEFSKEVENMEKQVGEIK